MSKQESTIVILSTIVEDIIRESLLDTDALIFRSVSELLSHTDTEPIRASKMFITQDVLTEGSIRESVEVILHLLESVMCRVDEVIYITNEGADEIRVIEYITKEMHAEPWEIRRGLLCREYASSVITGEGSYHNQMDAVTRRGVYKVSRAEYVKDKLLHSEILEEKYESEEEVLASIPDDDSLFQTPLFDYTQRCKVINNAGLPCKERAVFSLLMAQYCAFEGKTLLIESDFDFLTISDMVARTTKLGIFEVDIADLYIDFDGAFNAIKTCPEKLVVITSHSKTQYSYDFVFDVIHARLCNDIEYMIREVNVDNVMSEFRYNIVMPNNTVDVIKTLHSLPISYNKECIFVGLDILAISELSITDLTAFRLLISSILEAEDEPNVSLLRATSFILGGETHELRMYTGKQ